MGRYMGNQLIKMDDSKVLQDSIGLKRVCYGGDGGDLFLWLNPIDGSLSSFELTFYTQGDNRQEFLIYWDGNRCKTGLVDSKEVDGRGHDLQTPLVQFHNRVDLSMIKQGAEFLSACGNQLDQVVKERCLKILQGEYDNT